MAPVLIPALPDDLALQCLTRIPSNAYSLLRCVCRSWNALFRQNTILATRIKQNLMQDSLLVMARLQGGEYRWLAFDDHGRTWKKLAAMPMSTLGGAVVTAESKIYFIGGSFSGIPTKSVWSYEPSCGTWSEKSRMRIPRQFAAAECIGNQIFVLGGCSPGLWGSSLAWAEVYDPQTDVWRTIQSPCGIRKRWMHDSVVVDGKLFAIADGGGLVYDPACNEFSNMSKVLLKGWRGSAAVLNGAIYSSDDSGRLAGYDLQHDSWELVFCELPKMGSAPLLCAISGKLYLVGESSRGCNRSSEVLLVALDIHREEGRGLLRGRVLWSHVAECRFVISGLIRAVSLKV